ncbi:unnamed protein product [Calypogeia fissa]
MGLHGSRFMLFHRLVLLPPLVLLTLTCLYTSSTLSPFSSTHRLSFAQDVQCLSCESSSSFPSRSFLSLANFPASSYIRDIVLRHNVLNVEDSRGETTTQPAASRRDDANEVESFVYGQKSSGNHGPHAVVDHPHPDTTRRVKEEVNLPEAEENPYEKVFTQQTAVEEKTVQQEKGEETEDVSTQVEEQTNRSPSDEKPVEEENNEEENNAAPGEEGSDNSNPSDSGDERTVPEDENVEGSVQFVEFSPEKKPNWEDGWKENVVDSSVPEGNSADSSVGGEKFEKFSSESNGNSEESGKEDARSSVPEGKNIESSVQAEELSTETNDSPESSGSGDAHGSIVPDDGNAASSVRIVEFSSETKENFEGDRSEDHQLENSHLTSDDQASPVEHVDTPIETNVAVTQSAPAPTPVTEIMRYRHYNMTEEFEIACIAVQKKMDAITKSALPTEILNSPNAEDLDVNLLLRGGSPQGVSLPEQRTCEGRRIFVYDLPSKFNVELVGQCDSLLRWFNFCDYFMNEGMGTNVPTDSLNDRGEKVLVPDGSWFLTHQYALELIFHARLKHYPCLTSDANRADLLFVPYYGGLDVIRWHFKQNISNDQRDNLTFALMNWLKGQESWTRNNGIDHVFVLGKIGWDFRRGPNARWGSKLLVLPEMWKPAKLLIERDPWHPNDIGVPHPTFFHPKDDNEIRTWLAHVEHAERRYLVSFAGMPRPNMKSNVRGHLIQQCLDNPDDCFLLRCEKTVCLRPDSTMNLFLHSHFCMQPPGDSPTRRSVFDSLVGGCIPVLFDPYTAYYQYPWHLPRNASSYSVFIPGPDVMAGKSDIVETLKAITPEERTAMRTRIIREIIPGLLYSQPGTKHSDFRDAFDISVEALLHRVANLRAEMKSM